jgi:hypothetical protein
VRAGTAIGVSRFDHAGLLGTIQRSSHGDTARCSSSAMPRGSMRTSAPRITADLEPGLERATLTPASAEEVRTGACRECPAGQHRPGQLNGEAAGAWCWRGRGRRGSRTWGKHDNWGGSRNDDNGHDDRSPWRLWRGGRGIRWHLWRWARRWLRLGQSGGRGLCPCGERDGQGCPDRHDSRTQRSSHTPPHIQLAPRQERPAAGRRPGR